MKEESLHRIREMATEVCEREKCRLYDIEFVSGSRGKGRSLRVYIDRVDVGVSLDDCSNVSRGLSLLLDVDDAVEGGEYELEVSSPGLERVLRQKWHFESAIGKRIELKTKLPVDQFNDPHPGLKNRQKLTGKLSAIEGEDLFVELDGLRVKVPIAQVEKGKRLFEIGANDFKDKKR